MVGIGVSTNNRSIDAGRESASTAHKKMAGATPGWAMAFCGAQHDPEQILQGIRSELGSVPIVGGSAVGTITNDTLGYTGFECAVAAFPASIPQPTIVTSGHFDSEHGIRERTLACN